ncbi:MAG: hypothetical protein VW491_09200 [Gammaproteobacteria bacterium]
MHKNFEALVNATWPSAMIDADAGVAADVVVHHQSGVPVRLNVRFAAIPQGVLEVTWHAPGVGKCTQRGLMLECPASIQLWPQENHAAIVGATVTELHYVANKWGIATMRATKASQCARQRWRFMFTEAKAPPATTLLGFYAAPTISFHGVAGLPARIQRTGNKYTCAWCGAIYTTIEAWIASCAPDTSDAYETIVKGVGAMPQTTF